MPAPPDAPTLVVTPSDPTGSTDVPTAPFAPRLPTLPATAPLFTPTLPASSATTVAGSGTAIADAATGSAASWTSTFIPGTTAIRPIPTPSSAAGVDGPGDHQQGAIVPPRAPARSAWLRHVTLWSIGAALPAAFVGDLLGATLALVGFLALITWSGVTAANVRRTCPPVRHTRPPHPATSVTAWLFAPVVVVGAVAGVAAVGSWAAAAGFDDEGPRLVGLAAAAVVAVGAVLIAAYRPYAVLVRCAKSASADGAHVRRWFMAPLVAVAVAAAAQGVARLSVAAEARGGTVESSAGPSLGLAALWVASLALPWAMWLLFAGRAMRSLDSGVVHTHARAVREALEPTETSAFAASLMAPQAASVSVGDLPTA